MLVVGVDARVPPRSSTPIASRCARRGPFVAPAAVLFGRGVLIAAGTLLHSRLVREVGGYREMFWEEFDLYLRRWRRVGCRHAYVDRPLYTSTIGEPGTEERGTELKWRREEEGMTRAMDRQRCEREMGWA